MSTTFPGTVQTFTDPAGTSALTSPAHAELHTDINDTTEAIQTRLGVGAGTPTATNKLLVGNGNGTADWGGTVSGIQLTTNTFGSAAYAGTADGTTTIDLSTGKRHLVNMPDSAGTVTLAVSNGVANSAYIVEIKQGTAGLGTIGWFTGITWANAAIGTLTTTASKKDSYGFISTSGTTFDGYTIGTNI